MKRTKLNLHRLTTIGMFAALIAILSPFAIPIGMVPITLGLFAVLLAATTLHPLDSVPAVAVYLGLGAIGLPVFSGGRGGAAVLVGPTGGYLWSYLLTALAVGLLVRLGIFGGKGGKFALLRGALACFIGVLICYALGTVQYCFVTGTGWLAALPSCVLPFLPFDLVKCFAAAFFGRILRPIAERFGSR